MRYLWCVLIVAVGCTDASVVAPTVRPDAAVDAVVPDVATPNLLPFGEPCSAPAECESGVCAGLETGGAICSQECDIEAEAGCPSGWVCTRSPETGTDRCIPLPKGPPCAPCEINDECGGPDDQCLPLIGQGDQRICTSDCREADCPEGFTCREVGDAQQCIPTDGACDDEVPLDGDGDGVYDDLDNCPMIANDQRDRDGDAVGDDCDVCPTAPDPEQLDTDRDGFGDACDVCPQVPNPGQSPEDCVPVLGDSILKAGQFTSAISTGESGAGRTVHGVLGGQEPRPVLRSPNYNLWPISLRGNQ